MAFSLSFEPGKGKREVFQENPYTEIRKTYFLASKLGVDLYTGSPYTRVNKVVSLFLTKCEDVPKQKLNCSLKVSVKLVVTP